MGYHHVGAFLFFLWGCLQYALVGQVYGQAESSIGGSAAPYLFFLCFMLAGVATLVIVVAAVGNFRNSIFAFYFNAGLVTVIEVSAIFFLFFDADINALIIYLSIGVWVLGTGTLLLGLLNEYRSE